MPACQRRMVAHYAADFSAPFVPENAEANCHWEHLQDLGASLQCSPHKLKLTSSAAGQAVSPFANFVPIIRRIKSGFAFPFSYLLPCLSIHELGTVLLFGGGCIQRSWCFTVDCYWTWNNKRTEVRGLGKQNVTALKMKLENRNSLPPPPKSCCWGYDLFRR